MKKSAYFVYILTCKDGTFYVGITTDIDRRVEEHNNSEKGAKYTKHRRPVKLSYIEEHPSRSEATKREIEIKKLTHNGKSNLINIIVS